jgi:glycerol uptake facilitator-like aquaporin
VKSTGKQLLKHVVPAVIKPMRVLWNEVIGFVFLALGAMMAFSTYRNFRDVEEKGSPIPLIGGLLFALLMIYFGVTSFLRARKISRS